jgi:hypothetical protein
MIDALAKSMEALGGEITQNLHFTVREEDVTIKIHEYQDRIDHVLTKEEKYQLLKYEEDKRKGGYASKPNLSKYDYIFDGRLNLSTGKGKYFRDTKTDSVENQLGLILIELFEKSEKVRIARLEAEERARLRKIEEKKRRDFNEIRDKEIEKTIALQNMALDYDMACKIRALGGAMKDHPDRFEDIDKLLDWVNKKADWFDPTIARNDEYLGERNHEADEDRKRLKKSYSYW